MTRPAGPGYDWQGILTPAPPQPRPMPITLSRARRTTRSVLLVAMATVLAAGCDSPSEPTLVIAQREAQWRESEPAAYAFEVLRQCFCGPPATDTVTITVRNGTVESRVFTATGIPVEDLLVSWNVEIEELFPDIDRMFVTLRDVVRTDPETLAVRYHPVFGFPMLISVDFDHRIADEEYSLSIIGFRVLP